MNLVIDLGNTFGKIAVCDGINIVESTISDKINNKEIAYFISNYSNIEGAIFSSVANHSRELVDYLSSSFPYFLELTNSTKIPLLNKYQTPETLGQDRLAAVVGAHTMLPQKNVLVIDAGTAITFDLVTAKGEYIGGNISPGMQMRFKSLNKYTSKLPLLEADDELVHDLGTNTEEAIISGVINGLVHEIEGYISLNCIKFSDLQVVLTGGDANSFVKKLKSSIFVVSHLNLIGLNRILDYNAEQKKKN